MKDIYEPYLYRTLNVRDAPSKCIFYKALLDKTKALAEPLC